MRSYSKPLWRHWCFTKTWQIGSVDQVLFAQTQYERRPDFSRVTNAMNQYDGSATPACAVVMDREIPNITCFLAHACQQQGGARYKNCRLHRSTIELYRQSSRSSSSSKCSESRK